MFSYLSDFFKPLPLEVVGPLGSEKIIHGIRSCVLNHWGLRILLFSISIFKKHLALCLEIIFFFMTVLFTFQVCSLGPSVTVLILFCGIHLVV